VRLAGRRGDRLLVDWGFDLRWPIEARHQCLSEGPPWICDFDTFPSGLGALADQAGVHELGVSVSSGW
jgi:hypothetical protein